MPGRRSPNAKRSSCNNFSRTSTYTIAGRASSFGYCLDRCAFPRSSGMRRSKLSGKAARHRHVSRLAGAVSFQTPIFGFPIGVAQQQRVEQAFLQGNPHGENIVQSRNRSKTCPPAGLSSVQSAHAAAGSGQTSRCAQCPRVQGPSGTARNSSLPFPHRRETAVPEYLSWQGRG